MSLKQVYYFVTEKTDIKSGLKRRRTYIIITGLLLLFQSGVYCQKQKPKNESWYDDKPLHFGFSLGLNTMDFMITPSKEHYEGTGLYPEVSILNPGINIQIVSDYRPAKYFDIRFLPGVSFGQRNIRYYQDSVLVNEQQRLESSFLEFPLLLKFKGDRLNNVRPYLIGGFNFRYDLAGKKEYDQEKPVYLRLKRPDLYYELGAGLDFYLTFFKLSVELKMSTGFRDVLVRDNSVPYPQYANAIDKLNSRIWVLSFHFE